MYVVVLIIYGAITAALSVFTFALFAIDKVNAVEGRYVRIPERTLLFLSAIGGWIGSFAAMALLRHKNNSFRKNYFHISIYVAGGLWIITLTVMLLFMFGVIR